MFKLENKKQQVMAITLVGLVACVVVLFVCFPLMNESNKLVGKTNKLVDDIHNIEDLFHMKMQNIKDSRLISKKEIVLAIDEIVTAGKSKAINFISIEPRDITKPANAKFSVLPINFVLESEYKNLGLYLESLNNLQTSLINVQRFDITRQEERLPLIRTRLVLEVYIDE